MTRQFHRPARLDPEVAESIEGAVDTAASSELAHRSAQALVGGPADAERPARPTRPGAGRPEAGEPGATGVLPAGSAAPGEPDEWITRPGVVAAVTAHGVDTVAELWADSPATTLPGALWRLLLVREWIRRDPELVARRYATVVDLDGRDSEVLARFDAALAQAEPVPSPEDLRADLDRILAGGAQGVTSLAPAIATTARFLRALAAGSDPVWITDDADDLADRVTRREFAILATADELTEAARRAAAGTLD